MFLRSVSRWCLAPASLLPIGGLLVVLMASGCASVDTVALRGSSNLNNCGGDEAHSVVVRVYHLRGTGRFEAASFDELWDHRSGVLEDDLIQSPWEHSLTPATTEEVKIERTDALQDATALGIVANFCRRGENNCWRKVVPLEGRKTATRVFLSESCISID